MEQFWISELGPLTGTAEDAFSKTFSMVPDNTMALAKIYSFTNQEFDGQKHLRIDWIITDGDFKMQHVFQKLHVYDLDPKKRHKALNMFKLLYTMFDLKPTTMRPPEDENLKVFVNKHAGIKIQETAPNDKGRTYNWVSEVWPVAGFKSETGKTIVVESALTRNASRVVQPQDGLDMDIPF